MKLVIITGVLFWLGNLTWPLFNEPKVFYVPLAVFISAMLYRIRGTTKGVYDRLFIEWLLLLSYGNIIKQLFYNPTLAQVNDYSYGGAVTIYLIYKIWQIPQKSLKK